MKTFLSNGKRIALGVFSTLVFGAVLIAQVQDADTIMQLFDRDLYKEYKSQEVATLTDLVTDFESQQANWMPIAPPSTEFWGWTQDASPSPLPFDPKGFPKEFVAGLVPSEWDGAVVYPVIAWEDPKTRDRVFYNADGKEIGSVAAPKGYDARWYFFDLHPELDWRTWSADAVNELALIYDPSHLQIRYDLILDDDLVKWIAVQSIRSAATAKAFVPDGGGGGMMLMRLPAADSNIVIQAITRGTNGYALEIGYPNNFTNRLDIFTCTDLVPFWWSLTASNLSTMGTNTIYWTDTATNPVIRFYAAGNADVDSDFDGLTDAREKYLYHSNPTNRDSDGDGLVDGYSGVVSTNAYPGGAHTNGGAYVEGELTRGTNPQLFDTDGDGMGDGWEVANGHNPLDPNDPPNVSGKVFYSGRQTGTVWVIAVTSSNSWATNYCKTITGLGSYQIPNLPGTSYWIKAWMDSNGNGTNNAAEALGSYSNVTLAITNRVLGRDIVLTDPDGDGDTLPDWWEVKYFGATNVTAGTNDSDSDAYLNLEEYQADTDPTNSANHPWTISGTVSYAGPQTGTVWVVACTNAGAWAWGQACTTAQAGAYAINHLPPGTSYWVRAWRDTVNDNLPASWEACGSFATNPVTLNTNVVGVDFALSDPDNDGDGVADWFEVRYGLDSTHGGEEGVSAWWKLDETGGTNVCDATANCNNGVLVGASNGWTMGVIGNGFRFDGTNTYVEVPDSTSLKPDLVCVGLWVKPSRTYTNGTALFLSKRAPGGQAGYSVGCESGAVVFTVCPGSALPLRYPCALTADTPVHVAATYSGPEQRLYINGTLVAQTNYDWGTGSGSLAETNDVLRLGAASGPTPTNFFAGLLDDVRVSGGETWTTNQIRAILELGVDADGDGLGNSDEYHYGTCPTNSDTDRDGQLDGWEVRYGLAPTNAADAAQDADVDGLSNLAEFQNGCNPLLSDTDGDGIGDAEEVQLGTSPSSADTDGDGLTDFEEVTLYLTKPLDPDMDDDGLTDYEEIITHHTYPNCNDSDGDNLTDGEETASGTNPLLADSDGDGMDDKYELDYDESWPTDPSNAGADDDGDGFNTLTEYQWFTSPGLSNGVPYWQNLIVIPPGKNAIRQMDTINYALAVGAWGAQSATVRVRPLATGTNLLPQRLYHSQTPGFFINGTAASSMSSPIVVPPSATALEYRITGDLSAAGTNLYFQLKTTNDYQGAKCAARLYVPKITTAQFFVGETGRTVTVNYGTTGVLYVAKPSGTNSCRLYVYMTQSQSQGYGIPYLNWTDWCLVKVTKDGDIVATNTLNSLDYRSAEGDYYHAPHSHGVVLDAPGIYQCQVGFDLSGDGVLDASEVQEECKVYVLSITLEPITYQPGSNPVYNPSGIAVATNATYQISVQPSTISDAEITWSSTNSNISFPNGSHGRTISVSANGLGLAKLKVDIAGSTLAQPTIELKGLTNTTVPISVYIVCDSNGVPAVTTGIVAAAISQANAVYSQVAMRFFMTGSVTYVTNQAWFKVEHYAPPDEWPESWYITGYTNGTGALEVYFVNEIEAALGLCEPSGRGIVVGANGNWSPNVLAHEIGHACGWADIYVEKGAVSVGTNLARAAWEPQDWNNGPGPSYYGEETSQQMLVRNLLMYGIGTSYGTADIPLGEVYGVKRSFGTNYVTGNVRVGLDNGGYPMTRTPVSN